MADWLTLSLTQRECVVWEAEVQVQVHRRTGEKVSMQGDQKCDLARPGASVSWGFPPHHPQATPACSSSLHSRAPSPASFQCPLPCPHHLNTLVWVFLPSRVLKNQVLLPGWRKKGSYSGNFLFKAEQETTTTLIYFYFQYLYTPPETWKLTTVVWFYIVVLIWKVCLFPFLYLSISYILVISFHGKELHIVW